MTPTRPSYAGKVAKIVVAGPAAAGTTTLIRTISEVTVVAAAAPALPGADLDLGRITVDREVVLYLFGAPRPARYRDMWDSIGEGMIGYVLLVDATSGQSLAEARDVLAAMQATTGVPYVVALNRLPALTPPLAGHVRRELGLSDDVEVVACDATSRESVKDVLLALLMTLVGRADVARVGA